MRRRPLVLVPQFFGSLIYDRRHSRYLPFDQEATQFLLDSLHKCADAEAEPEFVSHFHSEGFWDLEGKLDADLLDITPPASHLCGPLTVHLEVAAQCNLSCQHCFAGALPRREEALSLAELDPLFRDLANLGCFRISLTGGEPLMRRDILKIIDLALQHGLQPSLTTNGLLLSEEMMRQLGRRRLVWLNVSLDGATPASNDAVRGAGSWQRVRQKLSQLREHARFSLAFTITSANAEEVEDCLHLAEQVGAVSAVFRPTYPVGTAQKNLHLMPTFEQYSEAISKLTGASKFGPQERQRNSSQVYEGPGCGAAQLICSISLGGWVNPCSYLGEAFNGDNLRQRSFQEIWNQSQTFLQMRSQQAEDFQGGCRARAQVLGGSIHAADPWQVAAGRNPNVNWEV